MRGGDVRGVCEGMCEGCVCVCVRELTVNSLLNVWLPANKKSFRFT